MTRRHLLDTLAWLAGAGTLAGACARPQATEVPAASRPDPACRHADGCCGGHVAGDATCGEDTSAAAAPGEPDAARPWTRRWVVAPGDMAEINLELAAGDTMAASFSTDRAVLAWNVHSHRGDEAIIHAEGSDAVGTLRHVAAEDGMFSFLWMNRGATPVTLEIELELAGTARVHSTHPAQ